jgi:hypothetical protein
MRSTQEWLYRPTASPPHQLVGWSVNLVIVGLIGFRPNEDWRSGLKPEDWSMLSCCSVKKSRKKSRLGRRAPVVGAMLSQEQKAFIKALSHSELSTVFLRELRKAMVAAKKKKVPAAPKANASNDSAHQRESGFGGEAQTSCAFPQLTPSKPKADEFSSSDCSMSQPAAPLRPGARSFTDPRPRATRKN